MAVQTVSYKNLAEAFQAAKILSATESGKAFSVARGKLKPFSLVAKDYKSFIKHCITEPVAQEKALKKFNEWMRKAAQEEKKPEKNATYSPFEFIIALSAFGDAFLASLKDQPVMNARFLKKAFKLETFKQFEAGKSVKDLQGELKDLSEKTIQKVAYWMNTYNFLKGAGKLDTKLEERKSE